MGPVDDQLIPQLRQTLLRVYDTMLATDKDGNLTKSFLDKYLSDEGLIESSSEYLIGQAEVQGFLIRVDENTWNWLS